MIYNQISDLQPQTLAIILEKAKEMLDIETNFKVGFLDGKSSAVVVEYARYTSLQAYRLNKILKGDTRATEITGYRKYTVEKIVETSCDRVSSIGDNYLSEGVDFDRLKKNEDEDLYLIRQHQYNGGGRALGIGTAKDIVNALIHLLD